VVRSEKVQRHQHRWSRGARQPCFSFSGTATLWWVSRIDRLAMYPLRDLKNIVQRPSGETGCHPEGDRAADRPPLRPPASVSSTCSACSPNLQRTCAASVRWRALSVSGVYRCGHLRSGIRYAQPCALSGRDSLIAPTEIVEPPLLNGAELWRAPNVCSWRKADQPKDVTGRQHLTLAV